MDWNEQRFRKVWDFNDNFVLERGNIVTRKVGYYYICLELYAGPFGLIEMIGSLGETNLLAWALIFKLVFLQRWKIISLWEDRWALEQVIEAIRSWLPEEVIRRVLVKIILISDSAEETPAWRLFFILLYIKRSQTFGLHSSHEKLNTENLASIKARMDQTTQNLSASINRLHMEVSRTVLVWIRGGMLSFLLGICVWSRTTHTLFRFRGWEPWVLLLVYLGVRSRLFGGR
jgi:hypothetical protein